MFLGSRATSSRRENLECALKLLANLHKGGRNEVNTIFEVLQEQSRL